MMLEGKMVFWRKLLRLRLRLRLGVCYNLLRRRVRAEEKADLVSDETGLVRQI